MDSSSAIFNLLAVELCDFPDALLFLLCAALDDVDDEFEEEGEGLCLLMGLDSGLSVPEMRWYSDTLSWCSSETLSNAVSYSGELMMALFPLLVGVGRMLLSSLFMVLYGLSWCESLQKWVMVFVFQMKNRGER